MHWVAIVVSGMLEAVWAHALAGGLRDPLRALVFAVALAGSLTGLRWAMRTIPLGTAYAMWTGIGAATTAVWAAVSGEPFGPLKVVCLGLVIAGVVGLELTRGRSPASTEAGPGEAG